MDNPIPEGEVASGAAGSPADRHTRASRKAVPPTAASTPTPAEQARARRHKQVHTSIVVVFGGIVPVLLIVLAILGLRDLQTTFAPGKDNVVQTLTSVQKVVSDSKDVNAYALASFMFAEHSNFGVVHDKQRMKVVVIQIGFAVASIGIMFILLGVNDGGAQVAAKSTVGKVDFKTASTGLVTFLIGAGMAYGAGIIPNEYTTVGVPRYGAMGEQPQSDLRADLVQAATVCAKDPVATRGACLVDALAAAAAGEKEKP
ncbi:hypothetical protein [Paraburkholderia sp. J10-1]|uniref:hypothetical protein n=1 Tax=Paraburkholderia sp. J10-1 TaxID=2805430 RepID=UPI002AB664C8|nr:hypothetical protein [Paraburkholderia sp. J10-1]